MKILKCTYGPIYLPIETIVRERDAKFLLTACAISRGYSIIIGEKNYVTKIAQEIGQGIILGVGSQPDRIVKRIRSLKESGLLVANLHEEGLVYINEDHYINGSINTGELFNLLDFVFSWGTKQEKILSKFTVNRNVKSIITGNPRFDLLRYPYQAFYQDEITQIREKYNNFILVNTNFVAGNLAKFYPFQSIIEQQRKYGMIRSANDLIFLQKMESYYKNLYCLYVDMIKTLAIHFPKINIVVRPHPSEDHDNWRRDLSGFPNVYIIAEGNVIKWILSSQVVLHTGCTTGIEAFVAGRPVLRYNPIYDRSYESELPNLFGEGFTEISPLIDRIQQVMSSRNSYCIDPEQIKQLSQYIANIHGDYSYVRILDSFDKIRESVRIGIDFDCLPINFGFKEKICNNRIRIARKNEAFLSSFIPNNLLNTITNRSQKFPGLSSMDVKQGLNKIFEISPTIRYHPFDVKEIAPDLILVYPRPDSTQKMVGGV